MAAGIAAARIGGSIRAATGRVAAVAAKPSTGNIAWLVNAQDCRWAGQDQKPSRDMQAGKVLRLERGLAEIEFDQGARVILQGPAGLELISASSALLHYGTLTARVPARRTDSRSFHRVARSSTSAPSLACRSMTAARPRVRVFKGEVEAFPLVVRPRWRPRSDGSPGSDGPDRRPHGRARDIHGPAATI